MTWRAPRVTGFMPRPTWNGRVFGIVDTGGIDPEHGGKSLLSVGSSDFIDDIKVQALAAIRDADAILLVTDGDSGITEPDREVAELLRRRQRKGPDGKLKPPIFVAVNKSEVGTETCVGQ